MAAGPTTLTRRQEPKILRKERGTQSGTHLIKNQSHAHRSLFGFVGVGRGHSDEKTKESFTIVHVNSRCLVRNISPRHAKTQKKRHADLARFLAVWTSRPDATRRDPSTRPTRSLRSPRTAARVGLRQKPGRGAALETRAGPQGGPRAASPLLEAETGKSASIPKWKG